MTGSRQAVSVTVIAGYLGAGKTTLLNHILGQCDTARLAVLVNDFGALNIDADLIELQGGQAYRLENGCICCNIGNSLISTLLAVLRVDPCPERILIEASGVADPARIGDIAQLSPSLRLESVIVLVDCERIRSQADDVLVGETIRNQLASADLVLANKTDRVSAEGLENLTGWIKKRFHVPVIRTAYGRVAAELLFAGLDEQAMPAVFDLAERKAKHPVRESRTQHDSVFWSWSFETGKSFRRSRLENAFSELSTTIVRAKGFVCLDDAPGTVMILQLTGSRLTMDPVPGPVNPEFAGRLVLIGTGEHPGEGRLVELFQSALMLRE